MEEAEGHRNAAGFQRTCKVAHKAAAAEIIIIIIIYIYTSPATTT